MAQIEHREGTFFVDGIAVNAGDPLEVRLDSSTNARMLAHAIGVPASGWARVAFVAAGPTGGVATTREAEQRASVRNDGFDVRRVDEEATG